MNVSLVLHIDGLERLISEMTYYVSNGMLNPTHSLTHSLVLHSVSSPVQWTYHSFMWMFYLYCTMCHHPCNEPIMASCECFTCIAQCVITHAM